MAQNLFFKALAGAEKSLAEHKDKLIRYAAEGGLLHQLKKQ